MRKSSGESDPLSPLSRYVISGVRRTAACPVGSTRLTGLLLQQAQGCKSCCPSCGCQGAARQERRVVRDLLDLPVRIVRIRADQLAVVCRGGCVCRTLVQMDGRQPPGFVIRIPQDVQLRVPRVRRALRALLGSGNDIVLSMSCVD